MEPNDLILDHLWLVRRLALRLKLRLPTAGSDELIGAGNLGLVQAAHAFTGQNNCKFTTYAYTRILGKMIDTFARPSGAREDGRVIWCRLSDVMVSSMPLPDQVAIASERRQMLIDAFVRLKPRHQDLLWDIYIEEKSKKQIAAERGAKYHKIVSAERAALNQLRTRVARPNPKTSCVCGCGETMPRFDAHWRPRCYRRGHNLASRLPDGKG